MSTTSSAYPVYADPDLGLYKLLRFNANMSEGAAGEPKRDYMVDAGPRLSRIWTGLIGALGSISDISYVGPKSQNGGEVIVNPSTSAGLEQCNCWG